MRSGSVLRVLGAVGALLLASGCGAPEGPEGNTQDAATVDPDANAPGSTDGDAAVIPDAVPQARLCSGSNTSRISGRVFAPNHSDPLPNVMVYALPDDATLAPPAPAVSCQRCAAPDGAIAYTQSNADGSFDLENLGLDAGGSFTVVFESGGFRHVERHVALGQCERITLDGTQTSMPGATAGEDTVPRIAIAGYRGTHSADVNDKFTHVLDALGLTEYDTFDPNKFGTRSTQGADIIGLISDATALSHYQVLVIPCGALGDFAVAQNLSPAMLANLRAWLGAGGRLYSSDLSYSVIDRAVPGAINFAVGTPTEGDPADIGTGLTSGTSLEASVDDTELREWLVAAGVIQSGASTIPVTDLRNPWAAVDSMPIATTPGATSGGNVLVSGDVYWHEGPSGRHHHPLTVWSDVTNDQGGACGRVLFTSYHVESGTGTALTPQEKVLEYLFFQLNSCIYVPG